MTNPPRLTEVEEKPTFEISEAFWIILNKSRSLITLIDAGFFTRIDPDVFHFPVSSVAAETDLEGCVRLFQFSGLVTSEMVLTTIEQQGYRPATIEELLALGAIHPQLQMQFPIVALGSSCTMANEKRLACITQHGMERALGLCRYDTTWSSEFRFAVVSKATPQTAC